MKAKLIALLSLVMLTPVLNAQGLAGYTGKPDKPRKQSKSRRSELEAHYPTFNKKIYFAGIALLGASRAADAWTARNDLRQGLSFDTSLFGSQVYGAHPSELRQSVVTGAFYAVDAFGFYLTEHSRNRWVKLAGRGTLGFLIVNHARSASCNAGNLSSGCTSSLF
jgi:hypothetical protein